MIGTEPKPKILLCQDGFAL